MSVEIKLVISIDTGSDPVEVTLYEGGFRHDLAPVWKNAGVYKMFYESTEMQAGDVLDALKAGVLDMISKPQEYKALIQPNSRCSHENALLWLCKVTTACARHPKAILRVCR